VRTGDRVEVAFDLPGIDPAREHVAA